MPAERLFVLHTSQSQGDNTFSKLSNVEEALSVSAELYMETVTIYTN